jgi:hypothetical protein
METATGTPIEIDWATLEADLYQNASYVLPTLFEAPLRMLLISCYEVAIQKYDANDPVWRFFRHCRNAAAHNGYFYLVSRAGVDPIKADKPVVWSLLEITMAMDGAPLLKENYTQKPFLKPGDVLKLLRDIEEKI